MSCYLVQQGFDDVAFQYGDKTALYCGKKSISYKDLYLSANQIAQSLKRGGVKRGDRVAIILPKSVNSVKAMLGILKADAIYVPVDSRAPLVRIKEIIGDCSPSAVICDQSTLGEVKELERITMSPPETVVLDLEADVNMNRGALCRTGVKGEDAPRPNYLNIDRDIAYILYTSGSTGKPKGVMISHLNIRSYINWAINYFHITSGDNILNTCPLHFDMSTFDVYCSLHSGASLTLVPHEVLIFPVRLIEIIEERGISVWKGVSSLLSYLVKLNALHPEKLKCLRKVIFSGEVLPTKYLIEWMKKYPNMEFYNAYGPTECTGISTCYKIKEVPLDAASHIPIGRACSNKEVFALDEDGMIAQVGKTAELFIKGSSLSYGYWNSKDLTEKAFITNPINDSYEERIYRTGDLVKQLPDGNYVFIGRKDQQIKHMGYRIELQEIEHALQGSAGVKDAAVVPIQRRESESPEIIAFIEINGDDGLEQIREDLEKRLPKYMIPGDIKAVRRLPRTENGKADRRLLIKGYLNA